MALSDIDRQAVERALEEYDRLERAPFLEKYGFGPANTYFIRAGDRRYDSKAILGAAHGFLSGQAALKPAEFSGGEATVARRLRELGFEVVKEAALLPRSNPFLIGQLYNRRIDIHAVYGGQQQGGIVTPQGCPFIFLFTGEAGEQHGYSDGWRAEGIFAYTGEGQRGNMGFLRGNRAIRDHVADGKDLLLFEATSTSGSYRYRGCFECTGWETGIGPDTNGDLRSTIIFLLVPVTTVEAEEPLQAPIDARPRSLEEMKLLAEQAASAAPVTGKDSRRIYYQRSATVRTYVLARARGYCEGCRVPAPFNRPTGEPYLEPHHVTRISDGGPDHPRHVIALCPTCHRKVHFGSDGASYNEQLKGRLEELEP